MWRGSHIALENQQESCLKLAKKKKKKSKTKLSVFLVTEYKQFSDCLFDRKMSFNISANWPFWCPGGKISLHPYVIGPWSWKAFRAYWISSQVWDRKTRNFVSEKYGIRLFGKGGYEEVTFLPSPWKSTSVLTCQFFSHHNKTIKQN